MHTLYYKTTFKIVMPYYEMEGVRCFASFTLNEINLEHMQ